MQRVEHMKDELFERITIDSDLLGNEA